MTESTAPLTDEERKTLEELVARHESHLSAKRGRLSNPASTRRSLNFRDGSRQTWGEVMTQPEIENCRRTVFQTSMSSNSGENSFSIARIEYRSGEGSLWEEFDTRATFTTPAALRAYMGTIFDLLQDWEEECDAEHLARIDVPSPVKRRD